MVPSDHLENTSVSKESWLGCLGEAKHVGLSTENMALGALLNDVGFLSRLQRCCNRLFSHSFEEAEILVSTPKLASGWVR